MNRIPCLLLLCMAIVWVNSAAGQTPYKLPSRDVVAILDAPPPPLGILSPTRDTLLLIEIQPYPSIEVVAEPILRLAGLRINPRVGGSQRMVQYTGLSIQPLDGSPARRIALPHRSFGPSASSGPTTARRSPLPAMSTTASSSGSPTRPPASPDRSPAQAERRAGRPDQLAVR